MTLLEDLDRDLIDGHSGNLDRLGSQVGQVLQRHLGLTGNDLVFGPHPAVFDHTGEFDILVSESEGNPPPVLAQLISAGAQHQLTVAQESQFIRQ